MKIEQMRFLGERPFRQHGVRDWGLVGLSETEYKECGFVCFATEQECGRGDPQNNSHH